MAATPQVILENERLKEEFRLRELEIRKVWQPSPHDLELENRQLQSLLDWVDHYVFLGGKEAMILAGFLFPPVLPGWEPEADWKQFERWVGKRCSKKTFNEIAPSELFLPPEWVLEDNAVQVFLDDMLKRLAEHDCKVNAEGLPIRRVYEGLRLFLRQNPLEKIPPGTVLNPPA